MGRIKMQETGFMTGRDSDKMLECTWNLLLGRAGRLLPTFLLHQGLLPHWGEGRKDFANRLDMCLSLHTNTYKKNKLTGKAGQCAVFVDRGIILYNIHIFCSHEVWFHIIKLPCLRTQKNPVYSYWRVQHTEYNKNNNDTISGLSASPFCISNGFWKDIVLSPEAHDTIFQVELPPVLTALNLVKSQRQSLSKWLSRNFHSCRLKGPTKEELLSFVSDGQYRIQTSKQEHCKGTYRLHVYRTLFYRHSADER